MPRRIIDLNGETWRLGQAPPDAVPERATWDELERVADWLPATVPGNVRADLVQAGRLQDLTFGAQAEESHWVDGYHWWLVREFSLGISPGERIHLILRGVDYVSDLFLNGQHLGRHEGMFSPQVHDVTGLLQLENRLAVRVVGSKWLPGDRSSALEKLLNYAETKVTGLSKRYPQRRDTLKCQMSFGWDFAPPLLAMGIWDDVALVVSGDLFIQDVATRQQHGKNEVVLAVSVDLDARRARSVRLCCTLTGETFDCEPLEIGQSVALQVGANQHVLELTVPQPRLWWPWDHGQPDLYRLSVEVWDGGELLDSQAQVVGLRWVELDGWNLCINGRRVYARGANWVPADILPGRVAEADYRELLTLAREANINMLRVWGGGLREKRSFYDLCDRLGILIWQEFPFACAFLTRYSRSAEYLRLVDLETRAIVRDLRNHACLALWCGGNEFDAERNRPLVDTLRRAVEAEDPTRPFLSSSPANGDSHNWQVWHNFQPPSVYRQDEAAFASEFGLQSAPNTETLRRFVPGGELWPPGLSWSTHGGEFAKLWRYALPFLRESGPTLEAFVQASQRAQAYGLQIAIEHYRRRKGSGLNEGCGGVLLWQLNEPWPAISWAIIDFYRQPKLAYDVVKRLFNPLLVSLDYAPQCIQPGDEFRADVWIVNDRAETLPGCRLEIELKDEAGQPVQRLSRELDVVADSAEITDAICWRLPAGGGWQLDCRVIQNGQVVAQNEYDLSIHDDIQPTLGQRVWAWLGSLVLPS